MEKINITFLGTGNAIPTHSRNHTSILLTYKNENILVDCGEGTQRQFRLVNISPTKLTRILLTHWHGDHILGLPGLLQTLAMSEYPRVLQIYGPKKTSYFLSLIEKLMGRFKIKLRVHELSEGIVIDAPEFQIKTLPMQHGVPSLAYSFQIKEKLRLDKKKIQNLKLPNSPLLKKLQQGKSIKHNGKTIKPQQVSYKEKGRKVTFILDTTPNQNAIKLAKESDILICESSFSSKDDSIAKEHKHLTAKQAAQIAKHSKSKSLVLTHLSQRYENNTSDILKEAMSVFKNTKIAKDLDKIEV